MFAGFNVADLFADGNFRPPTTDVSDIGAIGARWRNLYLSGAITATSFTGLVVGNVTGNLTGNVTGNLTGNVVGNVTGNLTGAVTGNASTATALQTARTLWGVSFDGTANVTAQPTFGAGFSATSGTFSAEIVTTADIRMDGGSLFIDYSEDTRLARQSLNQLTLIVGSGDAAIWVKNSGGTVNFSPVAGGNGFGGGERIQFLANAAAAPSSNPTSGGFLYASGGALVWRGSSGTVTTIAPA